MQSRNKLILLKQKFGNCSEWPTMVDGIKNSCRFFRYTFRWQGQTIIHIDEYNSGQ